MALLYAIFIGGMMDINTIKERVEEYVEQQIDDNVFERPLAANACIASAIAYAVGKGTKDELSLLQKTTILLQLPDFEQFRIGYYSDPDDELSTILEHAFDKEVARLFKNTHVKIAAETIDRHLIADAEAALEIAEYRDDSAFIDRTARNQIRAAIRHLKDRTAAEVDVATAIDAGSILGGLRSRRNDHKLHVQHGTTIERIDQVTEKLRQLDVLARPHKDADMDRTILEMVVELNNQKPTFEQDEGTAPSIGM
ncbi:hypothetical protein [Mesorhizobium sp. SP-1A]|uniref:hypothetical protein n=1 Tax=Mesorhizobium sp. SP-1A TaxID=3077840 RepID=UPI0028F71018|nr:hypothetical protein [Mesorhizobium sp. SP-1A]